MTQDFTDDNSNPQTFGIDPEVNMVFTSIDSETEWTIETDTYIYYFIGERSNREERK
jgi:hypothetical protein